MFVDMSEEEFKSQFKWLISNESRLLVRDKITGEIVSVVGHADDEKDLENAKIISAAPELQESLRRLYNWVVIVQGEDPDMYGGDHPLASAKRLLDSLREG